MTWVKVLFQNFEFCSIFTATLQVTKTIVEIVLQQKREIMRQTDNPHGQPNQC